MQGRAAGLQFALDCLALVCHGDQLRLPQLQPFGDLRLDGLNPAKVAGRLRLLVLRTRALPVKRGEMSLHLRDSILQRRGFAQESQYSLPRRFKPAFLLGESALCSLPLGAFCLQFLARLYAVAFERFEFCTEPLMLPRTLG